MTKARSDEQGTRKTCFVIMPFGGVSDGYFVRIYSPAIEQAGFTAIRADEVFRAGSILKNIVDLLSKSNVVLADLSENNRNVHYELGLAHALGKPTILIVPKDMPLFFDVGQERMITYDKDDAFWGEELLASVTRTIVETMRSPETAVPTAFMHIKPARMEVDEVIVRLRRIEEQLGDIARITLGGKPDELSRYRSIIKSLPAAEAAAERLLQSMGQEQAVEQLVNEGYKPYMADSAVATAAARLRRSQIVAP